MRCADPERDRTRRRAFRLALLTATALIAASPVVALAVDAIGAEVMPASALHAADPQPPALPASAATPISLPSFSEQESARLADAQSESGPVRIGFGRTLPAPAAADAAARWRTLSDGRHAAAWRISSPGALGLRLQLSVLRLPDGAALRFFPPGAEPVQGVSGAAINASLRQDAAAGASGEAAQRYWSPLIQGDTLTLEIELPADVDPQAVQIALPRLSHLFRLPFAETGPAACHQELPCDPDWDRPSRATALLLHTDERGATGVCTGVLLNDADRETYIPYLLTAQHCIAEQTRASSIETIWFHRANNCGGPSRAIQAVSGGADLLYAAKSTDTSLLRLRQLPPAGAVFSGWSATLPALGTTSHRDPPSTRRAAGDRHRPTHRVSELRRRRALHRRRRSRRYPLPARYLVAGLHRPGRQRLRAVPRHRAAGRHPVRRLKRLRATAAAG